LLVQNLISGGGTALASGSGAEIDLNRGGLPRRYAQDLRHRRQNRRQRSFFSGVTVAQSSFVEIANGGTQELLVATIDADAIVEVTSGGVGSLEFGTVGAGATVDALNGAVMSFDSPILVL
jgi:hypothetical protein